MARTGILKMTALTLAIAFSGYASAQTMSDSIDETQQSVSNTADKVIASTKDTMKDWSQETKEAWRQGKLESVYMLNSHLSAYDINTEVHGDKAFLSGVVSSKVEKELAQELAKSINGIDDVENNLTINADHQKPMDEVAKETHSFGETISDATTTASVKMKLISSEVKARDINVDTQNGVVTLTGSTDSEVKSNLAEQIAKNTDGVKSVKNKLTVAGLK